MRISDWSSDVCSSDLFDKLSARQVFGNEVPRQVPPAETGPEQVALGAGVVDQPLALARDALLGLLRFRLVVRDDDLDMQAEFVRGDGALCRSERVGWGACRHHLDRKSTRLNSSH